MFRQANKLVLVFFFIAFKQAFFYLASKCCHVYSGQYQACWCGAVASMSFQNCTQLGTATQQLADRVAGRAFDLFCTMFN